VLDVRVWLGVCLSSTVRRGRDEGNFLRNSLSGTRLLREVSPGNARGSTVLVLVLARSPPDRRLAFVV